MDHSFKFDERTEMAKDVRYAKNGYIPGVLYGKDVNFKIKLHENDLKLYLNEYIYNTIYVGVINDKKYRIKCQEIQRDPVSNKILHIDFIIVDNVEHLILNIPVHIIGSLSSSAKIHIPNKHVKVKCATNNIPQKIECDLNAIANGGKISTQDITIDGVKFLLKQNLVEVKIKK